MLRHVFFNFTRLINKALKGLNFYVFPKLNFGEPFSLKIELSSACTLKCVLCPAGENVALDRKQEFCTFLFGLCLFMQFDLLLLHFLSVLKL